MKKPEKNKVKPFIPVVPLIPGAPEMPEAPISAYDPQGSWTGTPEDRGEPVRDVDDD